MKLGELLERTYRAIHDDIVDGVATGGDATTIIDSSLSGKYQANKFKNWIAFITRTDNGLSPQGRYGIISAYVGTGTATISSIADSVQAGDEYSFCKGSVPLYTLTKLCNDALKGLGRIPLVDTSLTLAASTIRYTLPAVIKGKRPDYIYFREPTTFRRFPAPNWDIEPAASGSPATLVFKKQNIYATGISNVFQPLVGYTIVIHYQGYHEPLTAYSSPVNETIHDNLAVAACVLEAFKWKAFPRQKKIDVANWQTAKQDFEEKKSLHPIERPIRDEHTLNIGIFNR